MRRREFIGLMGTAALSYPQPGYAKTNTGLPLVGFLVFGKSETKTAKDRTIALRKGLQEEGFIEGKNYSLATRFAEGDWNRVPQVGKELGALTPRVFVVSGFPYIVSGFPFDTSHRAFPEIPLVFTNVAADPIALGAAQSYAHPGGTITGNVMNAVGGEEAMTQKRIGFFKQLVPGLARLGMIAPARGSVAMTEKGALQKVAAQLGFEFVHYTVNTPDDLEGAFAAGLRDDVSAFYISGEPLLSGNLSRVMTFVTASRKPAVGPYPDWGRAGLLMSYSADLDDGVRHAGIYAAKILKGANPADLPIEQASKFTLVINQKTANELGIVVPPTLLALADELIE
jgi:putative tryptophan/tyrosine transport system substrate-binding protein